MHRGTCKRRWKFQGPSWGFDMQEWAGVRVSLRAWDEIWELWDSPLYYKGHIIKEGKEAQLVQQRPLEQQCEVWAKAERHRSRDTRGNCKGLRRKDGRLKRAAAGSRLYTKTSGFYHSPQMPWAPQLNFIHIMHKSFPPRLLPSKYEEA